VPALAAYVLLSGTVFLNWLGLDASLRVVKPGVTALETARLPDLVRGAAHRPYVLRTLLPTTVRLVEAALPNGISMNIEKRLRRSLRTARELLEALGWEQDRLLDYLIACLLAYACLLVSAVLLRDLYLDLYPDAAWKAYLLPLFGLALLPGFFRWGAHFFYDFPTLLLGTWALLLLQRRRWRLFYPVFVLGLVNKETAVLLGLSFLAWQWGELSRRALIGHLAAQAGLFVLVRGSILFAYRHSPGPVTEMNLPINLELAVALHSRGVTSLLLLASVAASLVLRWRREGRFARAMLAPLLPLAALYLFLGKWGEIRFFLEAWPALCVWAYNAVLQAVGLAPEGEQPAPLSA